jgi:hypothetical protein
VRSDEDRSEPASAAFVRRIPADLAATMGEALADAANIARGRVVLATSGTGAAELGDSAFVEKLLRVFQSRADLHAVAFVDVEDPGVHPWRSVEAGAVEPHAVAWRATQPQRLPEPLPVIEQHPVAAVIRAYSHNGAPIQWRHLPAEKGDPGDAQPEPRHRADVRLRGTSAPRARQAGEKERRMRAEPLLPGVPRDWLPSFTSVLAWSPPETVLLHRFVDDATGMRIVSDHGEPPEGYRLEYWLGAANRFARPGTTRLTAIGDPVPRHFRTIPWDEPWDGPGPDERVIGNIEMPERPMLDQVYLAEHRDTGQRVLVAGDADPIADEVERIVSLGWIESYPSNPRLAPAPAHAPFGAVGLVRAVDREHRRHVYGAGEVPEGDVAGELGALLDMPERDTVPVWITPDGRLVAGDIAPARARPAVRDAARWALAPAAWEGFATPQVRARAVGRRSLSSLRHMAAPRRRAAANGTPPAGWIYAKERPVTILGRELLPLYAWAHPVTRDQFLSTNRLEGGDLGYGEPTVIGWLLPDAPVTGTLGTERKDIPWASRFGQNVRA